MQPQIILLWLQPWKKRPHCLYLWLWSASDMFLVTIKKVQIAFFTKHQIHDQEGRQETANTGGMYQAPFRLIDACRVLKFHCGNLVAPSRAEKRSLARNDVAWCSFVSLLKAFNISTKSQCKRISHSFIGHWVGYLLGFKLNPVQETEQTVMNKAGEIWIYCLGAVVFFISGQKERIRAVILRPSISLYPSIPRAPSAPSI